MQADKDIYKTSRFLYIIEAALEYFISILVTGAYLAKLTETIGISDMLTGVLTSFSSLGCGFQIIAIFSRNKGSLKRWVTLLHSINQLCFTLIYFMPFIKLSKNLKITFFVAFLLVGYIIHNVVQAPKINWFMSLVDDKKRGRFTANKEMVSLVGSMIFSFAMGTVVDHFEAIGNLNGAFIVYGFTIFALMLFHSASLIFSKEKTVQEKENNSTKQVLVELIKDKNLFKVILFAVLWNVANCVATPFYGVYQIKELGFTMTFVSILSVAYAIVRAIFSKPLGRFADKYSFAKMLNICLAAVIVGFGTNVFTIPENGKVFYTIFYMLHAIGMAGINSATINLIFDHVDKEKRVGALALQNTLMGFAGFFATIAVGPLVSHIQSNGNTFLGISVYAQQVLSAISVLILVVLMIYLNTVIRKIKNNKR